MVKHAKTKAAKISHLIISSSHNICGAVYVVCLIYAPLVIDLIFTSRPPWLSCFCCDFGLKDDSQRVPPGVT